MVTRFNRDTWHENQRWRETNNHDGCIYNVPVHIKDGVPYLIKIFVVEMNNDANQIVGIGRIVNKVHMDKNYNVYSDNNYNRYTYQGKLRITRDQIPSEILETLEKRLFKGKHHLKRSQGITQVPNDVSNKYLPEILVLFS